MTNSVIIEQLKREKILELLNQGKRIDGRGLYDQRSLSIELE